jgi:hypothetical protein
MQIRQVSSKKHGTRYRVNHRKGDNRVNRGGSWNNNAENCRVSNRNNNTPTNRNNNIGFRLSLQRMMRAGWLPDTQMIVPVPDIVYSGQTGSFCTILSGGMSRQWPKVPPLFFVVLRLPSCLTSELDQPYFEEKLADLERVIGVSSRKAILPCRMIGSNTLDNLS